MKKLNIKTTLIILTKNEITGLKSIINRIPFSEFDECFAVDFQSNDGTVEILKKHKISIIKQIKPGRGEAFRLGVTRAKGKYIAFFSPDGNENPADLPILIDMLEKGNDMVIASRFMKNSRNEEDDNVFKFRAWANRVFSTTVNIIWGGKVTDTINGFRVITKEAFKKINPDAQGYAIEFQMTIRALKMKMKIAEIPTFEGNRIGGESGSKSLPTGLRFLYYLFREIAIGE